MVTKKSVEENYIKFEFDEFSLTCLNAVWENIKFVLRVDIIIGNNICGN